MDTDLQHFLKRKILILNDHDTAEQAARAMSEQNVGCVLTSNRNGISGLVTDRDLVCYVMAEERELHTPLIEVRSQDELNAIDDESTVSEAIEVMKRHGVRRVPILTENASGRTTCVGIITLDELIVEELISFEDVKEILRPQVRLFPKMHSSRVAHRKEARREQAANIFFKTMAREMELDREESEPIVMFFLKSLIRRVMYTEAADLISSLPKNIQETLWDVPSGPDRNVNSDYIFRQMRLKFALTPPAVERRARGFWIGLEMYLLNNECNHILSQLPSDMQLLFTGEIFKKETTSKRARREERDRGPEPSPYA